MSDSYNGYNLGAVSHRQSRRPRRKWKQQPGELDVDEMRKILDRDSRWSAFVQGTEDATPTTVAA